MAQFLTAVDSILGLFVLAACATRPAVWQRVDGSAVDPNQQRQAALICEGMAQNAERGSSIRPKIMADGFNKLERR